MAALLNISGQIWLLLCQFLDESSTVSQSLSYLHADLSFWLLFVIELPAVEDEFLVLEKHGDF